jgi:hypothetical protein
MSEGLNTVLGISEHSKNGHFVFIQTLYEVL